MKVLFLSLQGLSPMHQATETELMKRHLDAGDEVHALHCNACLSTCSLNPTHNLIGCGICQSRARGLSKKVGVPAVATHVMDRSLFPATYPGRFPTTREELMDLEFEGCNVGRGAASSAISFIRDYELDLKGEHRELVDMELCNAVGALRNYLHLVATIKPEKVLLFNGRHSELLPMVDLCRNLNLPWACHERGSSPQRFQLFENATPHSIASRQSIMRDLWESASVEERIAAGADWFEKKRRGKNTDDKSYIGAMEAGSLPANFDKARHNIVIFNSSEDEMQTISEWSTPLFTQQNEVILRLLESLKSRNDVHLYVRMHPNLAVVDNRQTQELYAIDEPHVTVIRPTESIHSYTLCEAADVILTFASTIGIEATYWGTASVLYGPAFYQQMGAVHEPKSYDELLETLTTKDLTPLPRENTLPYGYYAGHYGTAYLHADVRTPNDVSILGEELRRLTPASVVNLIKYLPQTPRWLGVHEMITRAPLKFEHLNKHFSQIEKR